MEKARDYSSEANELAKDALRKQAQETNSLLPKTSARPMKTLG